MLRSELVDLLNTFPDIEVVVDGYDYGTSKIEHNRVAMGYVDKDDEGPFGGDYGDFNVLYNDKNITVDTPVILISRNTIKV